MRWGAAAALAALAVVSTATVAGLAGASSVVLYADFEAGTAGWTSAHDVAVLDTPPGPEGDHAAWVTAVDLSQTTIISQYWLTEAVPGRLYAADAWIHDDDPALALTGLSIEFVAADGGVLLRTPVALAGADAPGFRPVSTGFEAAPPGTAYLRVVVGGSPASPGARFAVDGITVTEAIPETPVFEPEPAPPVPVPAPPPAPAVATPRPTATPRPSPTPRPTATATPRPAPLHVVEGLANTRFEDGFTGWEVSRGRVALREAIPGFGASLVLSATGTTTAWVEQRLAGIDPDGWYEAAVVLAPLDGVEAAWLRIAWYASDDASGAQIATDDSPVVASPPPNASAREYELVGTGPVQPPPEARSARVRVLVRPADVAGASVAIDDVEFRPTEPLEPVPPPVAAVPPVAPAPATTPQVTPAPTATPPPAGTSPPAGTAGVPAQVSSAPVAAADATPPVDPATEQAQRWLRISELLPDPSTPGQDAGYEWVEIVNLGSARATLEGMRIVDNRAGTVLPAASLGPGEVVVIAAPLADVATPYRVTMIGNGLGNTGDTLTLVTAGGVEVDRLAYGDAASAGGDPVLPAPGPGRSIERWFSVDGSLAGWRGTATPSPGVYGIPPVVTGGGTPGHVAGEAAAPVAAAAGPGVTWMVLIALAAGMLGGAAMQQGATLVRERRARAGTPETPMEVEAPPADGG